jgi:hypothetical protein
MKYCWPALMVSSTAVQALSPQSLAPDRLFADYQFGFSSIRLPQQPARHAAVKVRSVGSKHEVVGRWIALHFWTDSRS